VETKRSSKNSKMHTRYSLIRKKGTSMINMVRKVSKRAADAGMMTYLAKCLVWVAGDRNLAPKK
jgi:hypothetical protein